MTDEWITVTNCQIIDDGKITIPKPTRDRYGFERGWIIDLRVHDSYPDDDPIMVSDASVNTKNRVTIGKTRLESNNLEDGDIVDVEIRDTGQRF